MDYFLQPITNQPNNHANGCNLQCLKLRMGPNYTMESIQLVSGKLCVQLE